MKQSMTATKAMRYGTRRLKAGDDFDASDRDARILSAIGKASYATRNMVAADTAPPKASDEDMTALRAEYQEVVGKRPFPGWDADEMRRRMAEASE